MKNTRVSRLAAATAVTALATAGLVAGTGTSAGAVSGSATYVCTTGLPLPGLDTLTIPVQLSTPSLDGALPARTELTGIQDVEAVATLPETLVGTAAAMLGITQLGAQLSGFDLWLGEGGQRVDGLTAPLAALPGLGGLPLTATGSLSSLVTPDAAGTYPLALPERFTMLPASAPVALPISSLPCTLAEGSDPVIGQVKVVKVGSTTSGTPKETRKGHAVTAQVDRVVGGDVFGKVVAKLGGRTVAGKAVNRNGRATLALPKKVHGKWIKLVYKGDSGTRGSKAAVRMP